MDFFTGGSFIMDYGPCLWIIVMFLSAVWTLILTAPIHCRGSIAEQVMQCYISPNLMEKQTRLHLGWPEGEDIVSKCSVLAELLLLIPSDVRVTSLFSFFSDYTC